MDIDEILNNLIALSNSENIEGMAKFGINPEKVYGIKIPVLRKMAKKIGKNHALAHKLWSLGIRETMILATMIEEPSLVTEEQIEEWVTSSDFNYWEIVDQSCMNLFDKTSFAYDKCTKWTKREEEFIKRAGFALIARLAWRDEKADNSFFESLLPIIERESTDDRNSVKKAVNWALRQIGKRNKHLNQEAICVARRIEQLDSKTAKWVSKDALKELTSQKIQKRLKNH